MEIELLIVNYGLQDDDIRLEKSWLINTYENEMQFQAACIMMLSQKFPRLRYKFWHTKNEGYIEKRDTETKEQYAQRKLIEGGRNKAQGMLAGVMDILIVHNGILYKIELKQPEKRTHEAGGLNDSQKKIHEIWSEDCPKIRPVICYTVAEVYLYCKWILKQNYTIDFRDTDKDIEIFNLLCKVKELQDARTNSNR